jgi:hypothetical protein
VTTEAAGGCGICYKELFPQAPARAAGTMAHRVIQGAFRGLYRLVEFPYRSPTDENGQLDLAIATRTGFKIGEIKPANKEGEEQGVKDLNWYRRTLQAAYPNSTIELMDVRVPGSGLRMPDPLAAASGCQLQTMGVTTMRPGLYGYWCAPPFSVARRQCPCRPGAGETETELDIVQTGLDAAAVAARLAGRVEEASHLEDIATAIGRGVVAAAAVTAETAEDVGIVVRGIQVLEEVFE